jgi:Zn-dependent protease
MEPLRERDGKAGDATIEEETGMTGSSGYTSDGKAGDASRFPEADREYEPIQPGGRDWRELGRKIWAPVAAIVAALVKWGAVLWKLKFFSTAISMVVSIGLYAWIGGWWFGLGIVGLIFVHELGHVLELKRQGVPFSMPLFIPFMGAVVGMKQLPKDAWREAQVALAGPLLGSIGAGVVYAVAVSEDSRFLKALAFTGFFINLFNLVPVVPLDGGRAVAALHPAIWLLGLAGMIGLAIRWHNPLLYIIVLLGALELWRRWQSRHHPQFREYYRVRPWQRAVVATVYLGLAALLVVAMDATHVPRDF